MSCGDVQKRRIWDARITGYRASGLSVKRFCAQEGVSTHTFYYWTKRLKAASGRRPPRGNPASGPVRSSAPPTTDGKVPEAIVRFRWNTGVEVLVPANCLAAVRCLAECLGRAGGPHAEAFQEVVLKA